MATLNLWELMTTATGSYPVPGKLAQIETMLAALEKCGASGQEISIEARIGF